MNKAKSSIQENLDEILANLPEEFHADLKKDIEEMADEVEKPLTGESVVAAIKAELKGNQHVDEEAAADELKDIKAPTPVSPASEAEIEEQKTQMLSEAQAQAEK